MTTTDTFGTYGVWYGGPRVDPTLASATERLGYGTLWIGGSPPADLRIVEEVLRATERIVIATGIVNIWTAEPVEVAASYRRIEEEHPGRFVLGIGSGHQEATPHRARPLAALRDYLDVLDAEGVPADRRLLAALGDRTLELAKERSLGAHPYLTLPDHTRHARGVLGEAFLAPEQKIVLAPDAEEARAKARKYLARYFGLSNYVNALIRFGVPAADFADGGSDALVDALAANPTAAAAVAALEGHLQAGADHVAVQPIGSDPVGQLERLSDALRLV
ncbi:TIGR03620 family F420-dependent LLM class oxidoreductase [Nocardioides insulae]|uniref:TIGR03620 family F420-dependent LLM class oxidoreductase n=1 Tax=Nocardioides insulae TaxID=394734 RepID=UPI0004206126|nr:TIGR03620 family F420-dependent LLM class oxidoreductase [Nocardioides insulae]